MRRLRAPAPVTSGDEEQTRRSLERRIRALEATPLARGFWAKTDLELPDGVDVVVPHALGRLAKVLLSPPRVKQTGGTTGRIVDRTLREPEKWDPTQFIVLRAVGFTIPVYVDVFIS